VGTRAAVAVKKKKKNVFKNYTMNIVTRHIL